VMRQRQQERLDWPSRQIAKQLRLANPRVRRVLREEPA